MEYYIITTQITNSFRCRMEHSKAPFPLGLMRRRMPRCMHPAPCCMQHEHFH